jgi:iron complex outermembrane receptor protein
MLRHTACCACLLGASFAASADKTAPSELEPVVITGTRIERALPDTPAGVTVLDEATLREGRQRLQLDEALARVPGLFLQNRYNFAQGQRLSLRGFGARAPFGVRGIRIRVDGFPETLPDGQSQIDSIDLDTATRAEVLRGPSSVLYGNASGGVVSVETADGRSHPGTSLRAQAGGDGFRKIAARSGGASEAFDYHAGISHLDYDGWREQSRVRKTLLNAKLGWTPSDRQRLEAVLTVLELPQADDPGGLNLSQLAADRRQATETAKDLDAGQDVAQRRLGLTHRLATGSGELLTRGFFTRRDFEQILPFSFPGVDNNVVAFQRDFFGGSSEYADDIAIAGLQGRYTVGLEAQRQRDDRRRQGIDADGQRTALSERQQEQATVVAGFGQLDIALMPRLTASFGARWDRLRLAIDDRLLEDGDDSGRREFTEASYSGGLVWQLAGDHRAYASVATAFESPSFTEFARPDGEAGFNPAIQPQESLNREIGLRNGFGGALHYELTLFSVRVEDEITPFQREGRNFFRNAGQTDREGVEAMTIWRPLEPLELTASYTYARLRFDRFTDAEGEDFSGNELPGIPRQNAFLEAAWRLPGKGFAAIDAQFTGSRYAENANALSVAGYTLVNARVGVEHRLTEAVTVEFFGGVNNLLDHDYIANLRVNANEGRPLDERGFFEPAPGRHLYAGLALRL